MNLNSTLRTTFSTAKPLTGESQNADALPTAAVYRNGVLLAPAAPPVVANIAVGQYSVVYGLTAANGHALNDWVQVVITAIIDGLTVRLPVFEGLINTAGVDIACLMNQTIYPMFTTHSPSTGANQAPDGGATPTITVYRTLVATVLAPVIINPAVGVYMVTLPLTAANGWAMGDTIDVQAAATIDGIAKTSWVFSGGDIVASLGGGGAPRFEVIGHALRFQ
jgi:hypothetical protein